MPLPGFVAERIAKRTSPTEIDAAIPVFIRGSFAFFSDILKGEKFASGMVEDTVHHNADPVFVAELHKMGEILVCAQAPVDKAEISCVVAVCG